MSSPAAIGPMGTNASEDGVSKEGASVRGVSRGASRGSMLLSRFKLHSRESSSRRGLRSRERAVSAVDMERLRSNTRAQLSRLLEWEKFMEEEREK